MTQGAIAASTTTQAKRDMLPSNAPARRTIATRPSSPVRPPRTRARERDAGRRAGAETGTPAPAGGWRRTGVPMGSLSAGYADAKARASAAPNLVAGPSAGARTADVSVIPEARAWPRLARALV